MADEAQRPLTRADLDRAVEIIAAAISESRIEIRQEIADARDELRRSIEANSIHLDRLDTRLAALALQDLGAQKWMSAQDRITSQTLATQAGIRTAIDQIVTRLQALEKAS
jgi:hypothetical protein